MHRRTTIPPIWYSGHCARGAALSQDTAHCSAKALARTHDELAFMIGTPAPTDLLADRLKHLREKAKTATSGQGASRSHQTT